MSITDEVALYIYPDQRDGEGRRSYMYIYNKAELNDMVNEPYTELHAIFIGQNYITVAFGSAGTAPRFRFLDFADPFFVHHLWNKLSNRRGADVTIAETKVFRGPIVEQTWQEIVEALP